MVESDQPGRDSSSPKAPVQVGREYEAAQAKPAEVLLRLGDSQARAGDLPAARANFLLAATIAQQSHDAVTLAHSVLGYGGPFIWSPAGNDEHLVPLLQDAIDMLAGGHKSLEVRLRARLACCWRSSPEHFDDSDSLSGHAVELARRLGDSATLSYALMGRFWSIPWPNNPGERLAIAGELLSIAEGAADPERIFDGRQALFVAFVELGLMPEASAQLAIIDRLTVGSREPRQIWTMRTYETVLALAHGDFDRAGRLVEVEDLAPSITSIRDDVSIRQMHRFLLRREQDRLAGEEASVRAAVADFPWYPFHRAALACLLLDLRRPDEASAVFEDLARDDFRAIYRDGQWLLGMSLASEACARLGDVAAAELLYRQLLPYAGRHAVAHAEGSVGAVDRYLGLLASVAERLDDAEHHLEDAILVCERMGAKSWAAHARLDLARVLQRRAGPSDAARRDGLLKAARESAQRLGMTALMRQLVPDVEPVPIPVAMVAVADSATKKGIFRREGEYWTVGLEASSARLRDGKGMRYLGLLLARPGAEMHVLDLVATEQGAQAATSTAGRAAARGGLEQAGIGDAGELLDPQARQAYRERLRELEADLAQAEDWNDPERAARFAAEREFLLQELAAAVGLGGRSRVAASATERARLNVGKAIRASIERIDTHSPSLGGHLGASVHTGTFCSYTPDPGLAISWDL